MAGFSDYLELKLLDHLFTDSGYTPPATLYVALSSTTPSDDGTGVTEPSGGSYARVATTAADWSAATGTAPASKTNTATIAFPTATADWASGSDLTHWVLYDAATVGNMLAFEALTTAKPVLSGDTAYFPASTLVLELGDPGDTY